jgi:CheY-like chemotaxis protein
MTLRIFVNVVGFNDVERHALNTVFRLSEERETRYSLWTPDAPEPAKLALVDGQSEPAQDWLEAIPPDHQGQLFWVGPVAPAHAARVLVRPLHWPDVVLAMDELFAPKPELDFDLDLGAIPAAQLGKRALVLDTDREARLYFRAKLASAGIYAVDEVTNAQQALEKLKSDYYDLAIIDMPLPTTDMNVWDLVADIAAVKPKAPQVVLVSTSRSFMTRFRAWRSGVKALLAKPPHPGKFQSLLQKI